METDGQKLSADQNQIHEVPDWLNESFFIPILKKIVKNDIFTIKSLKIKAGSAPGDNYLSIIHRCHVELLRNGKN